VPENVSTPTGKHQPVSNLTVETEAAQPSQTEPSNVGSLGDEAEPMNGTEQVERPVMLEAAMIEAAPDTVGLADIGAASFPARQFAPETVHGPDNRVKITQTTQYPWRVHASLLITARDGSNWIGTGWFIGPHTLVTAGHVVHIKNSGVPGRDGWVSTIRVMPGRNGSQLPFGSVMASRLWSVRGWTEDGDEQFDYGAIIIPVDKGQEVGWFGFGVFPDAELTQATGNISGYPGDKPDGTQWYDAHQIASVTPTKVHYDIDTMGGQSGSAAYVIRNGQRFGVAVHAYGGPVTNSGTRISASVFQNLRTWKQ